MAVTLAILIASVTALACGPAEDKRDVRTSDPTATGPVGEVSADAVSASPEHYRVLQETPAVRMLLASWGSGERDRLHSHPTAIWYALTGMTLRIEHPGHGLLRRVIAAGDTGVQQPVTGHTVANVGGHPAELVMFEIHNQRPDSTSGTAAQAPAAIFVANEFQLLEQHDGYRLVEAVLAPSRETSLHSHPSSLWLALTDASLRFREMSVPSEEVKLTKGEVLMRTAVRAHTIENTGPSEARLLILETP